MCSISVCVLHNHANVADLLTPHPTKTTHSPWRDLTMISHTHSYPSVLNFRIVSDSCRMLSFIPAPPHISHIKLLFSQWVRCLQAPEQRFCPHGVVHVILEAGQLKLADPMWPCSSAYMLSLATFLVKEGRWTVLTETTWTWKLTVFPICPYWWEFFPQVVLSLSLTYILVY